MKPVKLPQQTRNLISAKIHEMAAKSPDPTDKLDQFRKAICRELAISPKQLTFWEQNTTQPHIHQLSQVLHMLRAEGYTNLILDDLVQSM